MRLAALNVGGEALLSAYVAELELLGADVPERRYVQPGQMVAWDGEQFVVSLVALGQGQPGAASAAPMTPYGVNLFSTWSVSTLRVVPGLDTTQSGTWQDLIPEPEEIDAAGQQTLADASALMIATMNIYAKCFAGQYPDILGSGESLVVNQTQAVGPEGALAGTRVVLEITVL